MHGISKSPVFGGSTYANVLCPRAHYPTKHSANFSRVLPTGLVVVAELGIRSIGHYISITVVILLFLERFIAKIMLSNLMKIMKLWATSSEVVT